MGTISEILNVSGNTPVCMAQFVMSQNGNASSTANSTTICAGKSSGPRDFFENTFNSLQVSISDISFKFFSLKLLCKVMLYWCGG